MTTLKALGAVWLLIIFVAVIILTMYVSYILAIGLLLVLLVIIFRYLFILFDK